MKKTYKSPVISYKKLPGRKGKTIPDQSMSLRTIMDRYTRGVPAAVNQKEPIYSDQEEFDLEKVSRMEFGDRAAFAAELRERNERVIAAIEARDELVRKEREERLASEEKAREEVRSIDDLDNTMLRDTNPDNQRVGSKSKKS